MVNKKNKLLIYFFLGISINIYCQKFDSTKFYYHIAEGDRYYQNAHLDSSSKEYLLAVIELRKHDSKEYYLKHSAHLLRYIGVNCLESERYLEAKKIISSVIPVFKLLKNYPEECMAYNNLGAIYLNQGFYKDAMQYYMQARAVAEKNNLIAELISTYINLSVCYKNLLDYDNSLLFLEKARVLSLKHGRYKSLAHVYSNKGVVYKEKKDYKNALKNYLAAEKIFDSLNLNIFKQGVTLNLFNTYRELGKNDSVLYYYNRLIQNKELVKNVEFLTYVNMIKYAVINNDLATASQNVFKAKNYLMLYGTLPDSIKFYDELHHFYFKKGDYINAYSSLLLLLSIRDRDLNNNISKQAKELTFKYEDEKKQLMIKKYQNELKYKAKEIRLLNSNNLRNKIIIIITLLFLLSTLVFTYFIYTRLKLITKQSRIISKQKSLLEEKNHEIVQYLNKLQESIDYAKIIQESTLTTDMLTKYYFDRYFVIYIPKDNLSGDFYWFTRVNNYDYFVIADATGHGIPGALLAMYGISLIKELIYSSVDLKVSDLIKSFCLKIEQMISGENDFVTGDSIDIAVVKYEHTTKTLYYCGVNIPVFILDYNRHELIEVQPLYLPFGNIQMYEHEINEQVLCINEGDALFMSTDGYFDQFGGETGQKIGLNKYKELLKISSKSMNNQKEQLYNYLIKWKISDNKAYKQNDDITVIGIQL